MREINVIQFGTEDWSEKYDAPDYVIWNMMDGVPDKEDGKATKIKPDVAFICRRLTEDEAEWVLDNVSPYTVFMPESLAMDDCLEDICRKKFVKKISQEETSDLIQNQLRYFFGYSYGEKYVPSNMEISRNFHGEVTRNGFHDIELSGDFGEEYGQILFWKLTLPIEPGQVIEFWLEYEADENVDLCLQFTQIERGSISKVDNVCEFKKDELDDLVYIENTSKHRQNFSVSLQAKGQGKLKVTALHDRHSRRGWGALVAGGERFLTSDKEEILCYFDPGDMKPPLNVYFAGYRTQEGFEGRYMMKKLGCPFLLIADDRLEGGAFYLGSEEYENLVKKTIQHYMDYLGFTSEQLMFSGISMGTHGALYYGCDFLPHAVILGKPLVSLGDIAYNEKYSRPGVFPTSLDVLMFMEGSLSADARQKLNDRFWNKFDKTTWPDTSFIISYMIEDDYDSKAYQNIIEHLTSTEATVYGKGIHGRHNDDTKAIVDWFVDQYKKVLRDEFHRKDET